MTRLHHDNSQWQATGTFAPLAICTYLFMYFKSVIAFTSNHHRCLSRWGTLLGIQWQLQEVAAIRWILLMNSCRYRPCRGRFKFSGRRLRLEPPVQNALLVRNNPPTRRYPHNPIWKPSKRRYRRLWFHWYLLCLCSLLTVGTELWNATTMLRKRAPLQIFNESSGECTTPT